MWPTRPLGFRIHSVTSNLENCHGLWALGIGGVKFWHRIPSPSSVDGFGGFGHRAGIGKQWRRTDLTEKREHGIETEIM